MVSTFSIRRAQPDDAGEIVRLSTQLTPGPDDAGIAGRFSRMLEMPAHALFVVPAVGRLSGFVAAEHRVLLQFGERVELISLFIDHDARRQGAGAALVACVEAWARQRGIADMVVRSSLSRDGAHTFYQRIGYVHHNTQHVYTRSLRP